MNINTKISIFFSFLSIALFFTVFVILKEQENKTLVYEDKLVEKNMHILYDIFFEKTENLNMIAYDYSTDNRVIDFLLDEKKNLTFERTLKNKYSHFVIYDKNFNLKYATVYDINSDEYVSLSEDLNRFFKTKKINNYINNKSSVYFMTLDYEKIFFSIEKVIKNNVLLGYVFIARSLDSSFLSLLMKNSKNYISLLPTYFFEKKKNLFWNNEKLIFDTQRVNDKFVYSHLKIEDQLDKSNFVIRLKMHRDFFRQIQKNNIFLFYVFVITLIILICVVYMFINYLFTRRLLCITNVVKEVSSSKSLNLTIDIKYNDEISYLSKKLNEMFHSIDKEQHRSLKKERDFLQSVLDLQENIILITDGKNIQSTNKKFVDFFRSKDNFMTNIALLDDKTQASLLKFAKKYESHDKPAKLKIIDNKDKFFTFDVQKIDVKNYLICMNDVSKYNEKICHLEERANMDELTKTYNKSTTTMMINNWLKRKDFCLLLFDVDFFKKVNDTYGHYIGDCILRDLATLINSKLHNHDLLGRFGGEEFIVLLNDDSSQNIINISNRLRESVSSKNFIYNDIHINITISIGCTFCKENEKYEDVYKRADKALYEAKRSGRNKVCFN